MGTYWQPSITIAEDVVLSKEKGVFCLQAAQSSIGTIK
jgi:hypothetical protein